MPKITPPLKAHGGKRYLAERIVAMMPPHLHYVEPFFGRGAVLFARDPDDPQLQIGDDANNRGVSELINDLDGRLMNFWRVLQGEESFARFRRQVEAVPLARSAWQEAHAHQHGPDAVEDAVAFFVDCRQSRAGMRKTFTPPTRNRTRRGMNGNVSEWLTAVDGLADVHARLRRVFIENLPAVKVIRREDTPDTLFYCDPPYPHETRTATKVYGAFEMTDADHRELLAVLRGVKGKVILSSYSSELYDSALAGWNRHTETLPNNAAGGSSKREMTEVLWCNF
jgi:DNA adenine methylase